MIKTITDIKNNPFSTYSDIITTKRDNPSNGDVYYDGSFIYSYSNNKWEKIIVTNKQVLPDRIIRINKIKKIFNG